MDIVKINKKFSNGQIINVTSYEFTKDEVKRRNVRLFKASLYARALLIDHIFEDGNKRTFVNIFMNIYSDYNLNAHALYFNILAIIKKSKNISDIRRRLKYVLYRSNTKSK
jgi:hypothetical protein